MKDKLQKNKQLNLQKTNKYNISKSVPKPIKILNKYLCMLLKCTYNKILQIKLLLEILKNFMTIMLMI